MSVTQEKRHLQSTPYSTCILYRTEPYVLIPITISTSIKLKRTPRLVTDILDIGVTNFS